MRRLVSLAVCGACICSSTVVAGIVRVPGDSPTIQGGIDLAAPGDTVLVDQGVYLETLVISSPVALLSRSGPELTIVDAAGAPAHVIHVEEDADGSIIEGFTVRGANGASGIYIYGAVQTTVRSNIVEDNVNHFGGGVGIIMPGTSGSPSVVEGNVIRGNLGGKAVTGIWAGNAEVRDNWIEGNFGSEIVYHVYGTFTGNVVVGNSGDWSLRLQNVDCFNNTIASNQCGVFAFDSSFDRNILDHSWGNVALTCLGALPAASCNVFWGASTPLDDDCGFVIGENDNVYADPLFCDAENGDYRLAANSPAAVGSCGLIGALPVGCGVAAVHAGNSAPPAVPSLRAYPNPARTHVSLELVGGESREVGVFDVGGRLVDTVLLRGGRAGWDARGVPAGVYWLRVKGGRGPEARLVLAR